MHVYQMRSNNPSIVEATQQRMQVCMEALNRVAKVWLVAKMVHTLFLSILGNKVLEERLQKAPGKRHKKMKLDGPHQHSGGMHPSDPNQMAAIHDEQPPRQRFDDMSIDYASGPPAAQVSFERSRPQTPAPTAQRPDLHMSHATSPPPPPPHAHGMGAPSSSTLSPTLRHHDAFLGVSAAASASSRTNTRPPTPFNAAYSIPGTPPDVYLVTRNSPNLSQHLWENFHPEHLFPESSGLQWGNAFAGLGLGQPAIDPQLQMSPSLPAMMGNRAAGGMPEAGLHAVHQGQGLWGTAAGVADGRSASANALTPDDTWSNSSKGGPAVPMTVNTEDW